MGVMRPPSYSGYTVTMNNAIKSVILPIPILTVVYLLLGFSVVECLHMIGFTLIFIAVASYFFKHYEDRDRDEDMNELLRDKFNELLEEGKKK